MASKGTLLPRLTQAVERGHLVTTVIKLYGYTVAQQSLPGQNPGSASCVAIDKELFHVCSPVFKIEDEARVWNLKVQEHNETKELTELEKDSVSLGDIRVQIGKTRDINMTGDPDGSQLRQVCQRGIIEDIKRIVLNLKCSNLLLNLCDVPYPRPEDLCDSAFSTALLKHRGLRKVLVVHPKPNAMICGAESGFEGSWNRYVATDMACLLWKSDENYFRRFEKKFLKQVVRKNGLQDVKKKETNDEEEQLPKAPAPDPPLPNPPPNPPPPPDQPPPSNPPPPPSNPPPPPSNPPKAPPSNAPPPKPAPPKPPPKPKKKKRASDTPPGSLNTKPEKAQRPRSMYEKNQKSPLVPQEKVLGSLNMREKAQGTPNSLKKTQRSRSVQEKNHVSLNGREKAQGSASAKEKNKVSPKMQEKSQGSPNVMENVVHDPTNAKRETAQDSVNVKGKAQLESPNVKQDNTQTRPLLQAIWSHPVFRGVSLTMVLLAFYFLSTEILVTLLLISASAWFKYGSKKPEFKKYLRSSDARVLAFRALYAHEIEKLRYAARGDLARRMRGVHAELKESVLNAYAVARVSTGDTMGVEDHEELERELELTFKEFVTENDVRTLLHEAHHVSFALGFTVFLFVTSRLVYQALGRIWRPVRTVAVIVAVILLCFVLYVVSTFLRTSVFSSRLVGAVEMLSVVFGLWLVTDVTGVLIEIRACIDHVTGVIWREVHLETCIVKSPSHLAVKLALDCSVLFSFFPLVYYASGILSIFAVSGVIMDFVARYFPPGVLLLRLCSNLAFLGSVLRFANVLMCVSLASKFYGLHKNRDDPLDAQLYKRLGYDIGSITERIWKPVVAYLVDL